LYTLRVDNQICCPCRSITIDYVGTEVQNPIVIVHVEGFPYSCAFCAYAFDSDTSTTGGKIEIVYFVQNDDQKITIFLIVK
jgi:hypothetical protein